MENLIAGRAGFNNLGNNYAPAKHVTRENVQVSGVSCAWYTPAVITGQDVMIYIHGGGFIYGSIHSHAAMVSHIAAALQKKVLFIDYSLAPEKPFPGGLDDCLTVIKAFTNNNPGIAFGLIGDSAGGNLVLATQLQLLAQAGPQPLYNVVISPWTDLECKSPSYQTNKHLDKILSQPYLNQAAAMYAGSTPLSHPLLSPVNADFTGASSTLILAGTHEILEDDSIVLLEKLQAYKVPATLHLFKEEQHVWLFNDINTKASQDALKLIEEFVGGKNKRDQSRG